MERSSAEAVKWWRKAAKLGHETAQYNLGACYSQGEGVTKNMDKAIEWYRKAARQGNASAQYQLGLLYENGNGVEKDLKLAAEWYRKAAEQGNFKAKRALRDLRKKNANPPHAGQNRSFPERNFIRRRQSISEAERL